MSDTVGSTPAGWYADPANPAQLRWWDGTAWTPHTMPTPPPAPPPPPVLPVQQLQPVAPTPQAAAAYEPVLDGSGRAYVPFQQANAAYAAAAAEAQALGSPSTASSWVLATSILWWIAAELLLVVIEIAMGASPGANTTEFLYPSLVLLFVLVTVLVALIDQRALRSRGYSPVANPAWVLLSPLAYLIVRTVHLRKQIGRGMAPLTFYIVTFGVTLVLAVGAAIAVPAYLLTNGGLGQSDTQNAASFATGVANGLDKNGGHYTVTCTPFTQPTTLPVSVVCDAVDSSGVDHKMVAELDPSATAGGQPTVRLISVDPPLSH